MKQLDQLVTDMLAAVRVRASLALSQLRKGERTVSFLTLTVATFSSIAKEI